jgi:hypothetical protein
VTPLRQMTPEVARADVQLLRPEAAWRVRRNKNTDTPLPPEEPAGKNPPDGAILNYVLRLRPAGPVTLEILDTLGQLVRRYSSEDKSEPVDGEANVPTYWIRPPQFLSADPGMHRFVWDLRYPPPEALSRDYPISAIVGDTPLEPSGAAVPPGTYTVKLTAGGRSLTQQLSVKMDPRVATPAEGLQQQLALSLKVADGMRKSAAGLGEVRALRGGLKAAEESAKERALGKRVAELDGKAAAFEGSRARFGRRGGVGDNFAGLNGDFAALLDILQSADATPTTQTVAACAATEKRVDALLARWKVLVDKDAAELDAALRKAGLPPLRPR